jgi:Skp family chaperone for outer membrane proteins
MKLSYAVLAAGVLVLAAAAVAPPFRPSVVATVDIESVFATLTESSFNEDEVKKAAQALDAQDGAMKRELEDLKNEIEAYKAGTAAWTGAYKKFEEKMAERNAHVEYARLKVESDSAQRMADMYQRLKDAVKAYAKQNNIDYVLVNDSIPGIEIGGLAATKQQMALRRFLYANQEFDITADIVKRMNEEFAQRPKTKSP